MSEMLKRAARTFVQAAAGYLSANLVVVFASGEVLNGDYIKTAVAGLLMSAVAAGLAAIMNMPRRK